eukprot:NODE_5973_length_891_cov_110.079427_g5744_i0.p1 GENE.NODE_5973_length_891_cov_110.079427_g5744_i0~~NODE_5973_length_891_cov_110.079427_g5744_i0.p1  ORF type:complete len:179 (-),score=20.69 NODE_5973_length_891_cov_110.079427_g5744_i0:281-817(-)
MPAQYRAMDMTHQHTCIWKERVAHEERAAALMQLRRSREAPGSTKEEQRSVFHHLPSAVGDSPTAAPQKDYYKLPQLPSSPRYNDSLPGSRHGSRQGSQRGSRTTMPRMPPSPRRSTDSYTRSPSQFSQSGSVDLRMARLEQMVDEEKQGRMQLTQELQGLKELLSRPPPFAAQAPSY